MNGMMTAVFVASSVSSVALKSSTFLAIALIASSNPIVGLSIKIGYRADAARHFSG
ncbi:Uncharacterised protein [Arachnia propionica]|jgi:hypothetical protein|uniref:Uncharacterized protein n=3 Tax=Arachnia propionica TaxID=1750 RepID=A0A3S4VKK5_9ACTN|nr:Uncharacterised protein [Arachnia propionica]